MMACQLGVTADLALGRISGASPADDRDYVLVLFDISDQKKYRALTKVFQRYGTRVQKSVFEAHLRRADIKGLLEATRRIMGSERFFNPSDNVRIYRIAGNCRLTVFGGYEPTLLEENIFFCGRYLRAGFSLCCAQCSDRVR